MGVGMGYGNPQLDLVPRDGTEVMDTPLPVPIENNFMATGQDLKIQKIYDASAYRGTGVEYRKRSLPPKRMVVYYINQTMGYNDTKPVAIFYIERGRKKPEIVYLPGSERLDTETKKKIRKSLYEEVHEIIGLADMNIVSLTGGEKKEYITYQNRKYLVRTENKKKYILSKGEKVLLEKIRGQYRYV